MMLGIHLESLSTSFFEIISHRFVKMAGQLVSSRNSPVLTHPGHKHSYHAQFCLFFNVGVSNLNLDPHACKIGTLLTEPSPAATLLILCAPLHLTYSDFHELGI